MEVASPPTIAGSRAMWRWWVVAPLVAAALSFAVGFSAIIDARRYLAELDPRSIDGLSRGAAGIGETFGILGIACGAGSVIVAGILLFQSTFDRLARSIVWGSAAYVAGFVPWLGDPSSSNSQSGTTIWAIGALALLLGLSWSIISGFTRPLAPHRWWHASWLPWTPAFIAFAAAAVVIASAHPRK